MAATKPRRAKTVLYGLLNMRTLTLSKRGWQNIIIRLAMCQASGTGLSSDRFHLRGDYSTGGGGECQAALPGAEGGKNLEGRGMGPANWERGRPGCRWESSEGTLRQAQGRLPARSSGTGQALRGGRLLGTGGSHPHSSVSGTGRAPISREPPIPVATCALR